MRALVIICTVLAAAPIPAVNAAEAPAPTVAANSGGIELIELLERSAKRLNKRFIVDPRLAGKALLVNIDPDRITYRELQAILSVHGFIATQETEGTVRIVPDANMRQIPMPVLEQGRNLGEEDIVTRTIDVSPLNPVSLVPLLAR